MADIRAELRERLERRLKRQEELSNELESLEAEIKALRVLYELEQDEHGVLKSGWMQAHVPSNLSAGDFILKMMSDGNVWTAADLRDKATEAGLFRDSRSPGRSVQGILMGLIKQGKIRKADDSGWIISRKRPADDVGEAPLLG